MLLGPSGDRKSFLSEGSVSAEEVAGKVMEAIEAERFLVLPHPEMHRRAFVLVPLLEICPHWRHPVLGVAGRVLLARLGLRRRLDVRQALDFMCSACNNTGNESALRK